MSANPRVAMKEATTPTPVTKAAGVSPCAGDWKKPTVRSVYSANVRPPKRTASYTQSTESVAPTHAGPLS
jgi:hypothetical protein